MSKLYYYNKNLDNKGNHEVHEDGCSYMPSYSNRVMIGYESDCFAAINKAKRDTGKSNFDGCYHCCRPCNNG